MASKLVACVLCKFTATSTRKQMERHVAIAHGAGVYNTIQCNVCDGKFYDMAHFAEHSKNSTHCGPTCKLPAKSLPENVERSFHALVDQIMQPISMIPLSSCATSDEKPLPTSRSDGTNDGEGGSKSIPLIDITGDDFDQQKRSKEEFKQANPLPKSPAIPTAQDISPPPAAMVRGNRACEGINGGSKTIPLIDISDEDDLDHVENGENSKSERAAVERTEESGSSSSYLNLVTTKEQSASDSVVVELVPQTTTLLNDDQNLENRDSVATRKAVKRKNAVANGGQFRGKRRLIVSVSKLQYDEMDFSNGGSRLKSSRKELMVKCKAEMQAGKRNGKIECRICNLKLSGLATTTRGLNHAGVHLPEPLFTCNRCGYGAHHCTTLYCHMINSHGDYSPTVRALDLPVEKLADLLKMFRHCFGPNIDDQEGQQEGAGTSSEMKRRQLAVPGV